MKYYIIVGEKSGDMHAANLMLALKEKDEEAQFRFLGGEKMIEVGGECWKHYREIATMGVIEILKKLREMKQIIRDCAADVLAYHPDVLIMIDSSGFNLRVAKKLQNQSFKLIYYIAPKTWAYLPGRTKKLAALTDKVLCILPFEVSFFKKYNVNAQYVGNPLLDQLRKFQPDQTFLAKYNLEDKKIIAVLPGSRYNEVKTVLYEVLAVSGQFPYHQFIVAGVSHLDQSLYENLPKNIKVVFEDTYNLLTHSEAAVVASGTATLETALLQVPQVVVYKMNLVTAVLVKMFLTIPYVSLVNLVAEKEIVKELLQYDFNEKNVFKELSKLIEGGEKRHEMLEEYKELKNKVGNDYVSKKAAEAILGR